MLDAVEWTQKDKWPFGGPRHVFIADAIDRIAAKRFGDDWSIDQLEQLPIWQRSERLLSVVSEIRVSCSYGDLNASARLEWRGKFEPVPAERWNTERYVEWIATGQIPLRDFMWLWSTDEYAYLFIERSGLDLFLEGPRPSKAANGNPVLGRAQVAIMEAVSELWPSGIPESMQKKERNALIIERVRDKTGAPISERSVQRFFEDEEKQ